MTGLQRKIHRWVTISYHNGTQLDKYGHVLHCLDSLLQDIRCFADDTPMISTPESWGEGQNRKCRDWGKLEKWASAHNSCFTYINETQGVSSMFDLIGTSGVLQTALTRRECVQRWDCLVIGILNHQKK
jgi:hypothetical protein